MEQNSGDNNWTAAHSHLSPAAVYILLSFVYFFDVVSDLHYGPQQYQDNSLGGTFLSGLQCYAAMGLLCLDSCIITITMVSNPLLHIWSLILARTWTPVNYVKGSYANHYTTYHALDSYSMLTVKYWVPVEAYVSLFEVLTLQSGFKSQSLLPDWWLCRWKLKIPWLFSLFWYSRGESQCPGELSFCESDSNIQSWMWAISEHDCFTS